MVLKELRKELEKNLEKNDLKPSLKKLGEKSAYLFFERKTNMKILKKETNTDTILTLYSENGHEILAKVDNRDADTLLTYDEFLAYYKYLDPNIIILLTDNDFYQRIPTEPGSAWAKLVTQFEEMFEETKEGEF